MTDRGPLAARTCALLDDAAAAVPGTPWQDALLTARLGMDGPLRVALAGRVSSGKSTLLNALVGDEVASTDAGECTRVVTWYSRGEPERASAVLDGASEPLDVSRRTGRLVIDLGGHPPVGITRVEVQLDNEALQDLTLVDTPGTGSLDPERGAAARRFLTGQDGATAPDAIVYLMRQLHATDTDFLEAFRDPTARGVPPVNAVAVVSRADETGGGRGDAIDIAREIADGYGREARLRPFVQTVLPVAGLLAAASATMTVEEDAGLRALAGLSPAVTDPMLLSAERFCAPRRYLPLEPQQRAALLERVGLFGVRWALELLRAAEPPDPATLRRRMAEVSGLSALQDVLRTQIIGRRDVLKADAALRLVQQVATSLPETSATRSVAARAEELRAGVHDFAELRLLGDLRLGLVDVDDDTREQMEQLLGAHGGGLHTRLGLPAGDPSGPDELRTLLAAEHARWQGLGTDPTMGPSVVRAATVLQRTVEGMWVELPPADG